ncbi:MAG: hypothetical protein JOZ07_00175 [Solirubrobacterales bacterium]|nr:hypothetical protein [Solirubrobacterales bacterium]
MTVTYESTQTVPSATAGSLTALHLRPGERVRVRSLEEISRTLDEQGRLEGLPFMPEMARWCGRVMTVDTRADKTCDSYYRIRKLERTVHLSGVRCDGAAHGGCQAACLTYWKEAWLERSQPRRRGRRPAATASAPAAGPAPAPEPQAPPQSPPADDGDARDAMLARLQTAAIVQPATAEAEPTYTCQATELVRCGPMLSRRDLSQYVQDARNWSARKVVRTGVIDFFNFWQMVNDRLLPDHKPIQGGRYYPFVHGRLPVGTTPSDRLDLEVGEWVRIKTRDEIMATLDERNCNRGLSFDPEMTNYFGQIARVHARVNRILNEQTGTMIELKTDCVVLQDVVCRADYHRLCTRKTYSFWREVWLERVSPEEVAAMSERIVAPCGG